MSIVIRINKNITETYVIDYLFNDVKFIDTCVSVAKWVWKNNCDYYYEKSIFNTHEFIQFRNEMLDALRFEKTREEKVTTEIYSEDLQIFLDKTKEKIVEKVIKENENKHQAEIEKLLDQFKSHFKSHQHELYKKQEELDKLNKQVEELTNKLNKYDKSFEKIEKVVNKSSKNVFVLLTKPFIKTAIDDIIIILNKIYK